MYLKGKLFKAGSSINSPASIDWQDHYFTLTSSDGYKTTGTFDDLTISDRIGSIDTRITLPNGDVFITSDHQQVDQLVKHHKKTSQLIHYMESNLSWVVLALVIVILSPIFFFKWGLPWTAEKIAMAIPHEASEYIGQQALSFLDNQFFEESQLDTERIEAIREHFLDTIVLLDPDYQEVNYQLHFRYWEHDGQSIPNAFALPSGDIILTDKFVELSENQQEIDSVLLHEMGHVVERHSLQSVVRATMVTAAILAIFGDTSGLGDMGLGLGSLIMSASYSRDHEAEADEYAFQKMIENQIDPRSFSAILTRMTRYMESEKNLTELKETNEPGTDLPDNSEASEQDYLENIGRILDYISSHPSTDDRVEQANRYAECYQLDLTNCDIQPLD